MSKVGVSLIRRPFAIILFGAGLSMTSAAQVSGDAYLNSRLSPEKRAHDLVSRMTLQEKAEQSLNKAPAIPRLGVAAYDYWSEGLHGVARSGYSTLFPQAIGMAATWDAHLLNAVGEAVSTEARAKYNQAVENDVHSIYFGLTIWSPNINIFRDPRWGRGQETYGEDPFLTGVLGLNFVQGLQGSDPTHPRVIATPKHFAVHSGPESTRHSANLDPSPHDLWDTYLPQFRRAIVEGQADSIMCAYNAIYGKPACASNLLLTNILRDDWKFTGFVTSDCGAIDDFFEENAHRFSKDKEHAAAAGVLNGTDTNCGSTYSALPLAVKEGLLTEADLDRTLERLFVARMRLGLFDSPPTSPYAQIPFTQNRSPEHLALSLQTSRESMVLLKNDGILPFVPGKYRKIAVIGPNAASLSALEGNYNAVPRSPQMPVDALREAFKGAQITYAEGSPYADGVPLPVPSTMLRQHANGRGTGLKAEYFAATARDLAESLNAVPVVTREDAQIDFDWNSAAPVAGLKQDAFAVRWTGYIVPPQAGDLEFSMRLAHCYPCEDREQFVVKIDGKDVSTYATKGEQGRESSTPHFHVNFADTNPHAIEVDYSHHAPLFGAGITLEWIPPPGVLQREAVSAARHSDLVIAMVGLTPELEGEEMKIQVDGFVGGDRSDIKLPSSQVKMLQDVAATGKPIVVVLLNGSALAVHFAQEHANAILEAWYPGEFGGKAIADTLLGRNNPAGRLPVTFYNSVDELPPFGDYSMKGRTYRYFIGKPLYSFGYGLSYTTFSYSNLEIANAKLQAGDSLTAEIEVKNTGSVAGDEVAQLYLMPPASTNGGLSPKLQLEGFQRVSLQPGQGRKLRFTLSPRDLSEVDADGIRSVQAGEYKLAIGGSQPQDPYAPTPAVMGSFIIEGTQAVPR
jgi:beta-glucosidase